MPLTTHLPPELIVRIFDFVDSPTLVRLARSCKFLEACSRDILRKHRNAHAQYRVVTDLLPRSLTDTLRKASIDPITAWHVRELEFTSTRTNWSHWRNSNQAGNPGTTCPPDYAFTEAEQVDLLNQIRDVFHFEEQDVDKAREDLQQGNDAPLKLLLLGVCPRIRSVKFTRHLHHIGKGFLERESPSDLRGKPRSSLEYLHQAILIQVQDRALSWPVGLDSLEDLSIGVDNRIDIRDLDFAPSPSLILDLMQLPHLVSLYCFGLDVDLDGQDGTNASDESDESNGGSSSVQHIFLDRAHRIEQEPTEAIVSSCKQLKSLTIASSVLNDIDALIEKIGRCYRESFETLMFYDTRGLHGYRCNMFQPEAIRNLTNLRTIYVDASDVMLNAFGEYEGDVELNTNHEWIDNLDFFVEFFMNNAFPESMEVLVLGVQGSSSLHEEDAEFLDQAVTKMIEYGRGGEKDGAGEQKQRQEAADGSSEPAKAFERSFPNLKAVYLGSLDEVPLDEVYLDEFSRTQPRRKRWFSNAIAAGRRFGVDVHTRTTRGRPFHEIDFPKHPTVTSDRSTGPPPDNACVFNVYMGTWEQKCENCGTCEGCLEQYGASVWKEIENERLKELH